MGHILVKKNFCHIKCIFSFTFHTQLGFYLILLKSLFFSFTQKKHHQSFIKIQAWSSPIVSFRANSTQISILNQFIFLHLKFVTYGSKRDRIFAVGLFPWNISPFGHFVIRTFSREDSSPHRHFAVMTFRYGNVCPTHFFAVRIFRNKLFCYSAPNHCGIFFH